LSDQAGDRDKKHQERLSLHSQIHTITCRSRRDDSTSSSGGHATQRNALYGASQCQERSVVYELRSCAGAARISMSEVQACMHTPERRSYVSSSNHLLTRKTCRHAGAHTPPRAHPVTCFTPVCTIQLPCCLPQATRIAAAVVIMHILEVRLHVISDHTGPCAPRPRGTCTTSFPPVRRLQGRGQSGMSVAGKGAMWLAPNPQCGHHIAPLPATHVSNVCPCGSNSNHGSRWHGWCTCTANGCCWYQPSVQPAVDRWICDPKSASFKYS
jgi:hypothetical protein